MTIEELKQKTVTITMKPIVVTLGEDLSEDMLEIIEEDLLDLPDEELLGRIRETAYSFDDIVNDLDPTFIVEIS